MSQAAASTTTEPVARITASKAIKLTGWVLLLGFLLRFYFEDAVPYLIDWSESTYGYLWPRRGRLLLHVIGSSMALLIGPLQFWTGLRRRNMKVHRWLGKTYMLGVAIGAAGGYWLALTTDLLPGMSWSVSLAALATVWIVMTGMAFWSIRAGRVSLHKEWMVRSYVVTFAFVTFRYLVDSPIMAFMDPVDRYPTTIWLSWAIPLVLVEAVMQGRKLRGARKRAG